MNSILPSRRTGFNWMESTPRIATCGGLSRGVKDSIPKPPRLLTVKVAPDKSSTEIVPCTACAVSSFILTESSPAVSLCASRTTGTINPRGVSQANPI